MTDAHGRQWRPKAGSSATFEEVDAAREAFVALRDEAMWSPWLLEDRAGEHDQLVALMDQWERAEPGHRYLTEDEGDWTGIRPGALSVAHQQDAQV